MLIVRDWLNDLLSQIVASSKSWEMFGMLSLRRPAFTWTWISIQSLIFHLQSHIWMEQLRKSMIALIDKPTSLRKFVSSVFFSTSRRCYLIKYDWWSQLTLEIIYWKWKKKFRDFPTLQLFFAQNDANSLPSRLSARLDVCWSNMCSERKFIHTFSDVSASLWSHRVMLASWIITHDDQIYTFSPRFVRIR